MWQTERRGERKTQDEVGDGGGGEGLNEKCMRKSWKCTKITKCKCAGREDDREDRK